MSQVTALESLMEEHLSGEQYRARLSEISPCGYLSGRCGYCKKPDSGISYYANSSRLIPEHYQLLIDRGWRRSGTLLYKPDLKYSCCPHYTIRLPVKDFQSSRDQRQALHRWNRYVLGEKYESLSTKLAPKSREEKHKEKNSFDLIETVHKAEAQNLTPDLEPDHKFEVNLEHDSFTEEKYKLYQNYQRNVHKEPPAKITRDGFARFLCNSPLVRLDQPNNRSPLRLGSFHQCYRLDAQLIAMAVLDILPWGVSAVYFMYHHDFEKWSLGKLSALREAALAMEGQYDHYYMGYYIHSCTKMRYKGDYKQQHILDPVTYDWHVLDDNIKQTLEHTKYFSPSTAAKSTEQDSENSLKGERPNPAWFDDGIKTPAEAAKAGYTTFDIGMPGVMTVGELKTEVDMDELLLLFTKGKAEHFLPTSAIAMWKNSNLHDAYELKGQVADLVACVGPRVAKEMLIKMSLRA